MRPSSSSRRPSSSSRRSSAHLHCCACRAPIFIVMPVKRTSSLLHRSSAHLLHPSRAHLHCCARRTPIFIAAHPSSLLRPSRAHLNRHAGCAHLHCCAHRSPILIVAPVERPSLSPRRSHAQLHCCTIEVTRSVFIVPSRSRAQFIVLIQVTPLRSRAQFIVVPSRWRAQFILAPLRSQAPSLCLCQVVSFHGGLYFMYLSRNPWTLWNVDITLCS